jgi:3-dehydro-L-gulonate 2-dehydrogenase
MKATIRVDEDEARGLMTRVLVARGFAAERGAACAGLFAEATLDGVYTHGIERFPRFVAYVEKGWVKPDALPALAASFGSWERWDGRLGAGNLNALASMDRAVAIARDSGLGCVALSNTNHWMRGGQYGLRAADSGCIGICWTNTTPNLPAWGARDALLGNNPLVIAVPRAGGHVLLDMAMSQYSFGKMEAYAERGEELPEAGGYDEEGRVTRDPAAILASKRPLPIGFWKGSGLSLLLDLVAAILSGGDSVGGIGARGAEYGLSQVFIAFDLASPAGEGAASAVEEMARRIHGGLPVEEGGRITYPGERTAALRADNLARGRPLRAELWETLRGLAGG